jgi:hypothetical protein
MFLILLETQGAFHMGAPCYQAIAAWHSLRVVCFCSCCCRNSSFVFAALMRIFFTGRTRVQVRRIHLTQHRLGFHNRLSELPALVPFLQPWL